MPNLPYRSPVVDCDPQDPIWSVFPVMVLNDMIDAATRAFHQHNDLYNTSGWQPISMREAAFCTGAERCAELGGLKWKDENNLEVIRFHDANVDLNVYQGDQNVGTATPGFASVRSRKASKGAADMASVQHELFEEDDVLGNVGASRPGVTYLILLVYVWEIDAGHYGRRAQLAVNPKHNHCRILTAERIISIDVDDYKVTSSKSVDPASSDDGGSSSPINVMEPDNVAGGGA